MWALASEEATEDGVVERGEAMPSWVGVCSTGLGRRAPARRAVAPSRSGRSPMTTVAAGVAPAC